MEASTIPAAAGLASKRVPPAASTSRVVAGPLLRLRSDEQLVRLFRAGSDEAFRVIHDRYRTRLFAYARQMLGGSRADAEDALQDVFVRAYAALRASDREVSLRAWLYRIAHNRCVDELRRASGAGSAWAGPDSPTEVLELVHAPAADPMEAVVRRESLRRLVEDVRRLPEQQRSALLMREISGMAYRDLAAALEVTVPAVKSLLVRARIGLAQAAEARDTACAAIRADLADAHERGVRASGLVRRHLHDCSGCSAYRRELRALDARLAALVPALGPAAVVAKLLGAVLGGGGGSSVAGGGAGGAAASGAAAGGAGTAAAGAGVAAATAGAGAAGVGAAGIGAAHIAAVVAVAVVSAGGAVEMHQSLATPPHRHAAASLERVVAAPPSHAAWTASGSADAQKQRAAALRLQLRIVPATGASGTPLVTPSPLDASLTGPATGGASAPGDPPASTTSPATATPGGDTSTAGGNATSPSGSGSSGTTPVVGATSGSSGPPPPAPTDPTAPAPSSPGDSVPPATPAQPATSADPSPTTTSTTAGPPPTSATTGGATYTRS